MPKKGFQVVWLGLPKKTETDVKKFLKKRCTKKYFREIFRNFTGFDKVEEMDTKRLHLENFDKDMGEKMWFLHLKRTVEEQLQCIHEDMEVKYWSVLWSTKGCKRQTTHQDFGDAKAGLDVTMVDCEWSHLCRGLRVQIIRIFFISKI